MLEGRPPPHAIETRGVARLREAVERFALTFVQAPLGYGKTTAARLAVPVWGLSAWYEAQPWEREDFVRPLVDAVRTARPDFGRSTLSLAGIGAPFERLGAAFAADLEHVKTPLAVVFDDAFVLDGDAFGAFVETFARRAGPDVRIIVLARGAPTFGLAGLSGRGLAAHLVADDFKFDAAETGALAGAFGRTLADDAAHALVAAVDGWPAGTALALRSGRNLRKDASDSLESAALPLVAELVEALPSDVRSLLEDVTVFEYVDAAIARDVAPGALARLRDLERSGALVTARENNVRLHPLLRRLLLQTMRDRDGEAAVRQRHLDAARAYERRGLARAALFHVERADDATAMLEFLERFAIDSVASGLHDRLSEIVAILRARDIDAPATFPYVEGLLAKRRGEARTRALFAEAAANAEQLGNEAVAFAARTQLVEIDLGRGARVERDALTDLVRRSATLRPIDRATAAIRLGWHDTLSGDFHGALQAISRIPDDGSGLARSDIAPLRAYAHVALGEFERADRIVGDLLERLRSSDSIVLYVTSLVWAARLALLQGATRDALTYAREARRIGAPFELIHEGAALSVALAQAASHAGDAALTMEAAASATRDAPFAWYARDGERARALGTQLRARATFATQGGAAALRVAEGAESTGDLTARAALAADIAAYAAINGRDDAAELRELAWELVTACTPFDAADAAALDDAAELLGFFDARSGARERSVSTGSSAFSAMLAPRRGTARLPTIGLAVREAAAAGSNDAVDAGLAMYVRRGPRFEAAIVRAVTGHVAPERKAAGASLDALTAREREILELLAAGLTNREIAQRLVVSARTVETHVAHVLGKLGVTSRARAVAYAAAARLELQ